MDATALDQAYVQNVLGPGLSDLQLQVEPIRRGLVSASVLHARARYRDGSGKLRTTAFVVKSLDGPHVREAAVYEHLSGAGLGSMAPGLVGIQRHAGGRCNLYLEAIRPTCRWPWRDLDLAQQVLRVLAQLHAVAPSPDMAATLTDWKYEEELAGSAEASRAEVEAACGPGGGLRELRPHRRPLARLVRHLPELRQRLLDSPGAMARAVIHGDAHPGNVMIRRRQCRDVPVLLDWGRARLGSPMEDVSSWLQSLGYWEPLARQRHDTLLMAYVAARGLPARLDRAFRSAYWLAAASNSLAGALRYHVHVALSAGDNPRRRGDALRAAIDALRVIRRANEYCE